jgi:beta-glucosidase
MAFPQDFVWGAAAASYQVEGASFTDGKGLSVWDMLCRKPGAIWEGQDGFTACDHYHRYQEDVALMREIGLKAYRLSLSWPRLMPEGRGALNPKGVDFYKRLLDALNQAGIAPYVTLFHWDYPYELYCRGGWLNPDSPAWFAEYTSVVMKEFSGQVVHWMTLNEPQCFCGLGHFTGRHAPGDKLGLAELLRIAHHSLLAHGRAVQVIRAEAKQKPSVGYAPVGCIKIPVSDDPRDVAAARQATFDIRDPAESEAAYQGSYWNTTWWFDPVLKGCYPADGLKKYEKYLPPIKDGDLKTMHQPLDFLGVNLYSGDYVKAGSDGQPETVKRETGYAKTAFQWPVTPEILRWGPLFLHERYGLPLLITENGLSNQDWVALDGQVHDPQRIDFTKRYLLQLEQAIEAGVPVQGYLHWSIMDNFEWAEGYKERFGLIFVNYNTFERTIKDSGRWYRTVIESNGAALGK